MDRRESVWTKGREMRDRDNKENKPTWKGGKEGWRNERRKEGTNKRTKENRVKEIGTEIQREHQS